MSKTDVLPRNTTFYLILVWMAVNILLMLMLLPEDYIDLNNWIELGLWSSSIAGLVSSKKWGTALTAFTLIYTLSTSVSIVIYYQVWLNLVRVIVNTALTVCMFKLIFGK